MSMESRRTQAQQTLQKFLERSNRSPEVDASAGLYADGLGLDSLETAELSAFLEDEIGTDPFTEGLLPQTVGELLEFYGASEPVTS
jgi:acyl carrier protein